MKTSLAMWWQGRSRREQRLLALLGLPAATWIVVTLAIAPLWTARREARADIRTYEDLTARLQHGPLLTGRVQQRSGSPASILSASAAEQGLAPLITADRDAYRIVLADAPYDALIRWMADVEQGSHLRFVAMRIDRRPASGYVSADLRVRG